jgi:hypothetical protein
VGLADRDQGQGSFGEHLRKARHPQSLRRDEQKLQLALELIEANPARVGPRAAGVDALDDEALLLESGHLIFH